MRKIAFDSEMIDSLRDYIEVEGHTMQEAANKFGVSEDTIRRVRYENNIKSGHPKKSHLDDAVHSVSTDQKELVLKLFKYTDARMYDICKEVKLANYVVQNILREDLTEDELKERKSRI